MFCHICGTAALERGQFCFKCGTELGTIEISTSALEAKAPNEEPLNIRSVPVMAERTIRLAAVILDNIIALAVLIPAFLIGSYSDENWGTGLGVIIFIGLVVVQLSLLLNQGQSIGKMLLNIQVVKHQTYQRATFKDIVLLRCILPALLSVIPVVGLIFFIVDLLFIFSDDRRCLHDKFAGTVVVQKA